MQLLNEESIPQLLKEMSVEEKVSLLTGASHFRSTALEKYKIPAVYYLDGGTGANYMQMLQELYETLDEEEKAKPMFTDFHGKIPTIMECMKNPKKREEIQNPLMHKLLKRVDELTKKAVPNGELPGCFPPGIVMAASFDPDSIYESARALAKEAHYYSIDVLLGTPNINIHRDPRGGRLFEGYSEDPCLTAKLAPAFVKGIQDEGIVANVKHFAANNQETDRMVVDEHIPMRALQEIYLPGFKACVEAGCKSVMSAYNAINGVHCAENRWLLTEVLKKQWGFDGFVVSDWGAAANQEKALLAGNDVAMPVSTAKKRVLQAVENGELTEEAINESVTRFLKVMLTMPVMTGRKVKPIDREGSRIAAYNSVKESAILLKNENQTLPLVEPQGVCFYGEKSKQFLESGGGSANVVTRESTSLYQSMVERIGADKVTYEQIADETEAVVITVGVMGREGADRNDLKLPLAERKLLERGIKEAKAAGKRIIVILNVCGPVELTPYLEDIDVLLCIFIPGMEGGRAVADVLLGTINPSGKLPITFPKKYEDTPTCLNFPGRNGESWYGEGIFVGYRYYDYRGVEPMFPFGYGLSYTKFEIQDIALSKYILNKDDEGDTVTLSLRIKNVGVRAGKEVVQLYIGEEHPVLVKPLKELKDFRKVELLPGETKELTFTICAKELASYDEVSSSFQIQPDSYLLYVGTSSRDIAGVVVLSVEGLNPYGITKDTLLGNVAAKEDALDTLAAYCPAGAIDKEAIAIQTLGDITTTLEMYWNNIVKELLPMQEEQKQLQYEQMLAAMNRIMV